MYETLQSMTPAILVLLIIGGGTLVLAWWLALVSEGRDEWMTGADE